MLTRQQFDVLHYCATHSDRTQRDVAKSTGMSLGSVNAAMRQLKGEGLIEGNGALSAAGERALEPYKVDNAVIMAAGLSSRFAPISFERPKGVLKVKGEVLIERQIRQLHEAGIDEVIVVVGYMKEQFFYLEDEFDVTIVVNPDYAVRNNNSTIMRVADRLGNTYICSSDDYFTENPFERYVFGSYYAGVYAEGETDEYCLVTKGKEKSIVDVTVGGHDAWYMLGHAYWDRSYSEEFVRILQEIYDQPATADMLWEDVYRFHVDRLHMVLREYPAGVIWEFDSLSDLQAFDSEFIDNVDSSIMDNICRVLGCARSEIRDIAPIKQGLTNLSFRFYVDGKGFVYRHPGAGTDAIINRASEAASQEVGKRLGLDTTYIYEDSDAGWKISRYVEGADILDYRNWGQVESAMKMVRTLHDCGVDTGFRYDMHSATKDMIGMLDAAERTAFKDFEQLFATADGLNEQAMEHGGRICLCHNDFYSPNFLVTDTSMDLIDWEYSGMSDYASDLGVFICCSEHYTYEDALRCLRLYFGGDPEPEDLFHCVAYVCVISFYWFVWALYKDSCGDPVGEWLYLWYRCAKEYGALATAMANELGY
ncbi:MAG: NTP transferase domain-containing protein [Eggerthellaceae bacterium]|nr:NTP transferase domain-containing protein [Eggerthellaceae bacterium]